MKKYTAALLAALAVLIAVAAHTASAVDNVSSMTNVYDVVDTNHKWEPNEQYPVIDLFGEKDVPLFTANGNIWDAHINKLAKLVLDSNETYTLRDGEKLDLSQGYALEARQINIDEMKVWLEFTKDGQHVADQIISVNPDSNKTWTVAFDNVQGDNNIVVMKVHINNLFAGAVGNIVSIDGLWLIDYANARTIKVGDNIRKIPPYDGVYVNANHETIKVGNKIGEFKLEKIVSGTNISNQGSLVFENTARSAVTCDVVGTKYKCKSWSNIAADTANAANTVNAANTANTADNESVIINICDVVGTNYKCGPHEQYPFIDLLGDKYIPLFTANGNISNAHVNKLAKLITDSNEPYYLKEGEKLDLGHGYALKAKRVNIIDREAWLEFTKDGQYIADQIVSSINDDNTTWTVALNNVQGESDIVVMRIHVSSIGGLVEDDIIQSSGINIDGIWLTDYANARTLKVGDKIGEFKLEKIVSGANTSNQRSLVFENAAGSSLTCNVFGADYKCDSWSNRYPLINLFKEKDVPLLANNDPIWKCHVDKLAKLVLDSSVKYTLKTGDKLDLGQGYSIQAKMIDVDGKKVGLEFDKNGQYVDETIITTDPGHDPGYQNWTYLRDKIQGENNVPVLKVYVSDVYQGATDNFVQIDGLWLIDYANARTLKTGDKIGEYTLKKIISGTNSSNLGSLVFKKNQAVDFSSPTSEKGTVMLTNKSTEPTFPWNWDFWRFITIKGVEKREPNSTKTSNATI